MICIRKYLFLVLLLLFTSCDSNNDLIFESTNNDEITEEIIVELKGAVKIPGLYSTYKGVLLFEIINQAGGFSNSADISNINLVQSINSNSSIEIPYISNNNLINKKVNINTASIDELMTLDGIGESKALKIIEYRKTNSFLYIEDIINVGGIGEEIYSKIKDDITV